MIAFIHGARRRRTSNEEVHCEASEAVWSMAGRCLRPCLRGRAVRSVEFGSIAENKGRSVVPEADSV